MNNIHNQQCLLEAIDEYLLFTSVAPSYTPVHLNRTKDILWFIVSEQNDTGNRFIQIFNHSIMELNEWEKVLNKKNGLAYTLLTMRVQKELRRFKDVYLLQITG